ncbi:UDP-N-acetylbacillosamine N-acetyltransferase [Planctomycetes bacterium Poly30]|uniref:UDP-N-acetylbacillosamine N-acetyltransferase n=1 Tax=Saltatorellus ferox TaxID=2528018 RepID=A0A518EX23_9BACT|nr:UDP-N-acetylbacillosamine N-acetyltransferase [Planctomycetes bacterium Poly30]
MELSGGRKLLIAGASGFGKEVLFCAKDCFGLPAERLAEVACFLETLAFCETTRSVLGVPVISDAEFDPELYEVVVAIGDPGTRRKIVEGLPEGTRFRTLIHPSACVSDWVEIGAGSVITAGCVVTTDIRLGAHTHLNLLTTVGHDTVAGDYLTTAPGAKLSGSCHFGDRVYIGTNAAVRQGIRLCDDVTIGMGAMVVRDIEEPGVYVGSPAKRLER